MIILHHMTTPDYLKRILSARVYDVAAETPLDAAPSLSKRLGCRVLVAVGRKPGRKSA